LFPLYPGVGAAFGLGYISHLVADAMTIRGIPLLWRAATAKSSSLAAGVCACALAAPERRSSTFVGPIALLAAIVAIKA